MDINFPICRLFVLALVLLATCHAPALAAEYFVTRQGDDANAGTSRAAAFATIQKGVDALEAGDTLTIAPGEYAENVRVHNLGNLAQETVIRAERPGTVHLRGDRNAEVDFQPVPGRRFTHVADWDGPVLSVMETDSLTIFQPAPSVSEVDFGPGRYFYDETAKKLYLSSSDFLAPDRHHYRVSVREGHGLEINESRRVVAEGLVVSGFMEAGAGIMVNLSERCVIRACVAFFNKSGVTVQNSLRGQTLSPGGNVVELCRLYGNTEGVVAYDPGNEIFRDSHIFLNSVHGARFYGTRQEGATCRFLRLVSWGHPGGDYWFKGTGLSSEAEHALAEQCVAFKDTHIHAYAHGIRGERNYSGSTDTTTVLLPEQSEPFHAFIDRTFADPLNFDFRPQADTAIIEPGESGKYQGLHPYTDNIHYLSPDGSDEHEGDSVASAWKTLDHAVGNLRSGDTLYLADGRYSLSVPITGLNDVNVRGRGLATPVVDGALNVTDCQNISLQRIQWMGAVQLANSTGIELDNCVFSAAAAQAKVAARSVEELRLTHNLLAISLDLQGCEGVDMRGNLFAAGPGVQVDQLTAIHYSNHNSYPQSDAVWQVQGSPLDLEALRAERHDVQSRVIPPQLAGEAGAAPSLANARDFAGRGPLGTAIGPWRAWQPQEVRLVGPFLHSVTDSTANFEWWTTHHAETRINWGETTESKNNAVVKQASFFSHSMTGLEPGRTYFARIEPLSANTFADAAHRLRPLDIEPAVLEITTSTEPVAATRTLHVAPTGDDSAAGTSTEAAWRTLQHAADSVRPGDTVLIHAGEYPGAVYFRATGTPDAPISFKTAPGEKVTISGLAERLRVGFVLFGKNHYRFDGLYFRGFAGIPDNRSGAECGAMLVHGGDGLHITRCHFSFGWGPAISASYTGSVVLRNSAFFNSMINVMFIRCPDLLVENNVFAHTLIHHLHVYTSAATENQVVRNNIFGESTRGKAQIPLTNLGDFQSNNSFLTRWPVEDRRLFGGSVATGKTLPEYRILVGPTDSFRANPHFPGATGFRQGWGPGYDNQDFTGLFAANPRLVARGIGLQPQAFDDFHFGKQDWPYDKRWADQVLARLADAEARVNAGADADALRIYLELVDNTPMEDLLAAELLGRAAECADRIGDFEQALALARRIPVPVLSTQQQAALLHRHGKHTELIEQFADEPSTGAIHLTAHCPDDEHPLADILFYRATAYAEMGDLEQAENDMRTMVDKGRRLGYSPGPTILDLSWKRLGDFYRDHMEDDAKALEAYAQVLDRTTVFRATDPMPKPVLSGKSEVLAAAVEAACAILRRQDREDEARDWEKRWQAARAEAAAFAAQAEDGSASAQSTRPGR